MTETPGWAAPKLRLGPTIEDCYLVFYIKDSDEEVIGFRADKLLQLEHVSNQARQVIANHLRGVQDVIDQHLLDIEMLPTTSEGDTR